MEKSNLKENGYFGLRGFYVKFRAAFFRPFLFCCIILLLGLSQCTDEGTGKSPDIVKIDTPDMIKEADLPRGKQVFEEDINLPIQTNTTTALGNKNHGDKNKIPSTAQQQVSRTDYLKKKFKNLLIFHADDTMEVNKPKLATLILSKNESIEKLKVEVLEESNAADDNVKTDTSMDFGSKMKAKLVGFGGSRTDNSFEIEPLGDEVQSFKADRKKILWQWKITPLKPGQQELKLSIQIIEKDGESVSLPARNIPVVIFSKPQSFMGKVGDFISNRYEFLITAIMIPIIIAWFTTRLKNKNITANNNKAGKDNKNS